MTNDALERVVYRRRKAFTFHVGQIVTWDDDPEGGAGYLMVSARKKYGNGPFTVAEITEVKTSFRAVGHHQFVTIAELVGFEFMGEITGLPLRSDGVFSGAYFMPALRDPEEP